MKVEHQADFNLIHNYLMGDEGAVSWQEAAQ